MNNPTVKQIIEKWLKANNYTGLFNEDCGCELDDLMPCAGWDSGLDLCRAGYKHLCDGGCEECYRNEYCDMDFEFSNMYISGEK